VQKARRINFISVFNEFFMIKIAINLFICLFYNKNSYSQMGAI